MDLSDSVDGLLPVDRGRTTETKFKIRFQKNWLRQSKQWQYLLNQSPVTVTSVALTHLSNIVLLRVKLGVLVVSVSLCDVNFSLGLAMSTT